MGWNSLQSFGCGGGCLRNPYGCVKHETIKWIADKLVSEGWRDLGYKYVILDECWQDITRDIWTNKLIGDKFRFHQGMKALGKYIHSKGLLFGINIGSGTTTCKGFPGSAHFLELDAKTLAEWEVDYVKINSCNTPPHSLLDVFEKFVKNLNKTGRPMVILCNYISYDQWFNKPHLIDWKRLKNTCNLIRDPINIENSWSSVSRIINQYILRNDILVKTAGPGTWNDPDMMILGHSGLSDDQKRVHMGMWCMFAAPLLITTDMVKWDKVSASLFSNKYLIAIDQDKGGHLAEYITTRNDVQV
ncbi:unnamed protein product, partial [Schistosoma turkestanicum]